MPVQLAAQLHLQPIETGLLGELSVEVVKGLKGGESLVSGPFRALRSLKPGDPVEPEKSKKPGGSSGTS